MNTFSWKLGVSVSSKCFKSVAFAVLAMAMRLVAVSILLLVPTQHASADDKPKPSTSASTNALPQLLIVDYLPISKTPIASSGRGNELVEYVYRVSVRNSGGALADVTGKVTSSRNKVLVTDANVSFGAVGSRLTVNSTDTFSIRADKNFDRRLDRKVKRNNRHSYEDDGEDDDDKHIPGLGKHDSDWLQARIDAWYTLKLSQIFSWNLQARQTNSAPVVTNMSPTGNIVTVQPTISANYADVIGIAVSGVILKLDGADVTPQATVTTSSITYRPSAALTQGAHSLILAVANTAGKITTVTWSFTVDSLPPTIFGEIPKDTLNAASNSSISAQYSDAGTGLDISKVQLLVDGQDVTANSIKTVTGISYTPTTLLSQGNHNVVLKLSDTVGNLAQSAWSFSVDTSAPLATGLAPANGVELPADALPTISAIYSDAGVGIDVTRIKLSVDGVDVTTAAQITATDVSYRPSIALKEGAHAVKLTVVDKNGNSADTSWSFVTKTPPTISFVSPKDILIGANTVVTINAQYSDVGAGIDTTKMKLLLDGTDVTSSATITEAALSLNLGATLPQGLHLLQLTVTDKAGNSTATSWRFTIDTGLPVISNEQPKNALIATGSPVISANFQDSGDLANASGIDAAKTKLWVNNVDVTAQAILNATSVPGLISYTPTSALTAGVQTVKLQVTDKADNLVESQWSFTVDAQGPMIVITSPVADAMLAADALPVISATFSDANAGIDPTSVLVELDGQNITSQAAITTSGLSFTPTQALPEGNHALRITVKDKAGNATVQTASFSTSTSPTISAQSPKDTFLTSGAVTVITASYSDVGSGIDTARTKLSIDGADVTAQATITAIGISYTAPQAFANGVRDISLVVADKAGNKTTSSWRFTVDTGLPVISNEQPKNIMIGTVLPVISANLQDTGDSAIASGIDPTKTKLWVNNIDVTALATVNATTVPNQISYTPTTALAAGVQTVKLQIADKAGNLVESPWTFTVDGQGPTLTITSPTADAILAADALPLIAAIFSDTSTGIDATSILVELNGQNITGQAAVTATGLSFTPTQALPEGSHTLRITVKDKAGNATVQTLNFKTASAPVVSAQTPKDTFLPGGAVPVITASYSDVGSGIDTTQTKFFFNGTEVTAQATISDTAISYTVPQALVDGTHTAKLMVADKAGNATTSEWQFGTASPPEITASSPKDVLLPAGSRPTITASYQDLRAGINTASVRLIVNSDDVTSLSQVTATGISYTPAQALASGPYTIYLEVANQTNAAVNAVWGFEVDTLKTYAVTITSPAGAQTVIVPKVTVTASASANKTYPTRLTVGGVEMASTGTSTDGSTNYSGTVDLIDGLNTLTVVATYADGETRSTSTQVSYDAPPKLTILSPADKAVLGPVSASGTTAGGATNLTGNVERPVTVTGRLSKPVTSVTINQQQAQLEQGGLAFSFPNFFLREGSNLLTAVATDAQGRVVSSAIAVNVDQTAPILRIESPEDKALTSASKIDIRGMVNDAVEALNGAPEPTVSVLVNGQAVTTQVNQAAQVSDRYFLIPEVPLQIGANTLRITATDHLGNARSQDIQVSRIAAGSDRLTLLGGNRQSAAVNTELTKPLSIIALNAAGEPIANLPVNFDIMRGTGAISTSQGTPVKTNGLTAARNLIVNTDANGKAQVWLTVGKQTGPGANVVKASHVKFGEEVTFTASTQRGAVFKISADLGTNQIAETNAQPLELLSAVVRDAQDNLLPNIPVVLTIEAGDASFPDSTGAQATAYASGPLPDKAAQRIVLNTDKNGLIALRPLIGNLEGTVRIKAQALKAETGNVNTASDLIGNATFLIQAKEAKDGPASFKGYVYDDKSRPLANVKVSIGRTASVSTTDANGLFQLDNIPPGRIDLFVDGRTVNPSNEVTKPQYPSLHFEAYAIKGRENQIAHPIYLPPLSTSPESVKTVGGAEDVILTIPGLAGFQMKVKANSVTFPDGSRVGTLVVSPVTADKLPMAPPAGGAQFGVPAWTVQPAGTRFDPPIEVTLPNASSQPAGDNLPIVQWDHDLGQYVAMGRATVSEDGSVLITDSGSGITKAGWGGLCRYDPDKCAQKAPPDCKNLCDSAQTRPGEDCPTCLPDTKLIGKKDVEISTGVGPYQFDLKVRELPIPIFQTPKISTYGSLQGQMEIQDECCAGGSSGVKKGRRYALKATAEVGFEGQLKIARFPIIVTAKAAAAGSVLLEGDACQTKPPVNGELEALGELRFAVGAYDEDDIKLNLVSAAGIGKGKTKWTKEGRDLVVAGTFEVDGEVTLLQFKLFGIALTGVTIKFPKYESPPSEIYRQGIFP